MPHLVCACVALLLVSTRSAVIRTGGDGQVTQQKQVEPKEKASAPSASQGTGNLRSEAADANPPATLTGAFSNTTLLRASQGIITTTDCFTDTGGTCMVQECASWRNAQCGGGYKCVCPKGSCSGGDGKCYQQEYENLGKFRIRNVMFPDHYIYVSTWFNGLYVTETLSPQSDFILKRLPDNSVIMTPMLFPQYIIRTTRTENCDSDGDACTTTYSPKVSFIGGWFTDMSAPTAALNLEIMNHDGQDYVMMANADYPNRYFSASNWGSGVKSNNRDGGLYSYWTFEPPLPFQPAPYKGRRCSMMCGW